MVRMGKNPKGWSNNAVRQSKNKSYKKPSKSSLGLQVGRVSPNLIISIYSPLLVDMATKSSEECASLMLSLESEQQEEQEQQQQEQQEQQQQKKINNSSAIHRTLPNYLFQKQETIDEFVDMLRDTSRLFTSSNWKASANAAKFERHLDEKYGWFLPLIKRYPESEQYLKLFRKKLHMGDFSMFRKDEGPLSATTSVILLFMMHRNGVRFDAMVLTFLFLLVGLQPWALVLLVTIGRYFVNGRKNRKVQGFGKGALVPVKPFYSDEVDALRKLKQSVGQSVESVDTDGEEFDAIIIGSGVDSLYSAALLSRCGWKIVVLSETSCAARSIMNEQGVCFDLFDATVNNVDYVQGLLAPALATVKDPQGGIRFNSLLNVDSLASCVLEYGAEVSNGVANGGNNVFVVRGGQGVLALDASMMLDNHTQPQPQPQPQAVSDDTSLSHQFIQLCQTLHSSSPEFYFNKMLSNPTNTKDKFAETAQRPASACLDQIFANNDNLKYFFAALGMPEETISMDDLSFGVLLSNISNTERHLSYPVGGMRALGHALQNVILQNQGQVYTNAHIQDIIFDKKPSRTSKNDPRPKCVGVTLKSPTNASPKKFKLSPQGVLLSHKGFISTFYELFPEAIRSKHGIPPILSICKEQRPHFKLTFTLKGSQNALDLSNVDYKRKLAVTTHHTTAHTHKFTPGKSYIHITFPSTKDPTFKKRHPDISTALVTIEADDDFVRCIDSKNHSFYIMKRPRDVEAEKRLVERVTRDLIDCYPQLEGHILSTQTTLHGPFRMGLSHTTGRYHQLVKDKDDDQQHQQKEKEKLNSDLQTTDNNNERSLIHPGPFYDNLYFGGSDLTLGSFAGSLVGAWMSVNAILGYDYWDYKFFDKNVTTDIRRFLTYPRHHALEEAFPLELEEDPEQKDDQELDEEDNDEVESKKNI